MTRQGSNYFQIFWAIICFIPVKVVNLFAFTQMSSNLLFGNKSMLVNITTNIGELVCRYANQYIAIRGYRATTPPVVITRTPRTFVCARSAQTRGDFFLATAFRTCRPIHALRVTHGIQNG